VKNSGQLSYWVVLMARAIVAAAVALVITFSADHSASFGFVTVGAFAIVTGAVIGRGTFGTGVAAPILRCIQAAVLIVGGAVSLALLAAPVEAFLFLVIAIFGAAGVLELVVGIRAADRESIFLGALGGALAIAALVIPSNYALTYVVNEESRVLTASVMIVGVFGVYAAISAVYLVIAALSAKWSTAMPVDSVGSEA
jgi:uncharacterized membrane protein HdeD (DUF308 family)